MTAKKKIVTTIVVVIIVAALCGGGFLLYKHFSKSSSSSSEKVYVQKVSSLNTVSGSGMANSFAGVIEAQKSVDVKYDSTKTIAEVLVKNDDVVKKGDKLLTYDVDAIQLELDQGNLEIERMESEVESNKSQITQLEKEKVNASQDAVVSYNTQILSLQSDNAKAEYDIKAKKVEVKKLEQSIKNAFVTASIDGIVKNLKTVDELANSETPDVIMQLSAEGDYLVKGTINEQNVQQLSQGTPVIIKSRVDDTKWNGEVSEIDTNPQSNNNDMYSYGNEDASTTSSKYAFYVTPESLDGFLLGQHVIIELDNGQDTAITKTGIWLYSDFICKDGDKNYVWAKDEDGKIEKREVEIGEKDDENGDCEIKSGLETDDYIAYPAKYIEEGMEATTNQSDVSVAENDLNTDDGDGMLTDDEMMMGGDDGTYIDDTMTLTEEQMSSMTDEEIEAYYNELYGITDSGEMAADENGAAVDNGEMGSEVTDENTDINEEIAE